MPVQRTKPRRPGAVATCLALAAMLAVAAFLAPAAAAALPTYRGASADGEVVFFETEEQLVPGDTDGKRDIYERSFDPDVGDDGEYVTREISTGPTGGNDAYNALFERASADGSQAFFSTKESLVAVDTDREADVYVRDLDSGATRLVSRGTAACQPGCGNGAFDAGFAGAAADGDQVFIVTAERLDPSADTDGAVDVYLRDLVGETTSLLSAGGGSCAPACGNGAFNATLRGVSAGGSRAFFTTDEKLVATDIDSAIDIYARDLPGGPTTTVSVGAPACSLCGNDSDFDVIFAGTSADGSKVFFTTAEGLVPGDLDGANDVYRRADGTTTLVSGGVDPEPASFAAAPGDSSRIFFVTAEPLVGGADSNGANDIYMWEGGAPELITSGNCCDSTFGAVTSDAETVIFTTTESLAAADSDGSADIYQQDVEGGAPVLISAGSAGCSPICGNEDAAARFNRASSDGLRVFFTSDEVLSSQDFDSDDDIYARDVAGAATTLSTPPPGLCPLASCDATFVDASTDATHVFFQTIERLVAEDVDSEVDIYERGFDIGLGAEATRLLSTGNSPDLELGPAPPLLTGTAPGSPNPSTEPLILGQAQGGSAIKIYPTSSCSGEPVATGTAEELAAPGLGVTVAAGSTTSFWATAEAEGFTSLCSNPVAYRQESTAPPPPGGDSGEGSSGSGASSGGAVTGPPVKTHNGIAYVAPVTRITFGPSSKTRTRRPVFRFTDSTGQPGTRFNCKIDRGVWKACGSPTKLKRLRPGRHVFSVKAVNAVGTPEAKPASRVFKLVSG
jgi:Tol biopolymer transport system component